MATRAPRRVRSADSLKPLSYSYNDIVRRLNELLKTIGSLADEPLIDSEICRGIHVAWLQLTVWASDIDQETANILDSIWEESSPLEKELDSRLRAIEYALTRLEKVLKAKEASTLGQLNSLVSSMLDAVTLLVEFRDPVIDLNKAKASKDMASCIDRALKKSSDQFTPLSEFDQLLSTEYAEDLSELQYSLILPREISTLPEKPPFLGVDLRPAGIPVTFAEPSKRFIHVPDDGVPAAMAMKVEPVFSPIDRRETRLATIYPGKSEQDIVCSIQVVQIHNLVMLDYEAISYVWNFRESSSETIWVAEVEESNSNSESVVSAKRKRLRVRPHILECFQQLRRAEEPVRIWVDVLCLDLGSTEEKRSQSVNFADVFAHARRVSIWLGRDDQILAKTRNWVDRLLRLDSPHDLELTSAADWEPFLQFLHHDLFSRRWMVQEMILASQARFLSGETELEWQSFSDAISLWDAARSRKPRLALKLYQTAIPSPPRHLTPAYGSYAEIINNMRDLCIRRDESGKIISLTSTLEELVVSFLGMTNSEPRDAVFAYLFLAADTPYAIGKSTLSSRWKMALSAVFSRQLYHEESWYLNYSYRAELIFEQFVKHCIRKSASLDIICRPWAPESSLLLPSWMKKRRGQSTSYLSPLTSFIGAPGRQGQIYHAAGDTKPVYKFRYGSESRFEFNPPESLGLVVHQPFKWRTELWRKMVEHITHSTIAPKSLLVNAFLLGEITEVSPRLTRGLITRECLELGGLYFPDEPRKWTSKDIPRELWQTLVADQSQKNDRPFSLYPLAIAHCLSQSPDGDLDARSTTEEDIVPSTYSEALTRIREVTWNRKLFRAGEDNELLGLAPADAEAGDFVFILFGCSVPVVVHERRIGSNYYFELIGESFVHGKMEGEALEGLEKAELEEKTRQIDIR